MPARACTVHCFHCSIQSSRLRALLLLHADAHAALLMTSQMKVSLMNRKLLLLQRHALLISPPVVLQLEDAGTFPHQVPSSTTPTIVPPYAATWNEDNTDTVKYSTTL
jgi:hypothetical protein